MILASLIRNSNSARMKYRLTRVWERYYAWRQLNVSVNARYGAKFDLKLPDSIQTSIFLTGVWEKNMSKLISSALRPADIFVDVGANIGWYTIMASKLVGSTGKVFAFEASPSIYNVLLSNLAKNNIENVQAFNIAVSDHLGSCPIYNAPVGNIGHSTIIDSLATTDGHTFEKIVKCDRLSSLLEHAVLFDARFIKIDIEGAERLAIDGVAPFLKNFSERCEWLIELSPEFSPNGQADISWIFDQFSSAGYKAFRIENNYERVDDITPSQEDIALLQIDRAPTGRLNDILFSKTR